MNAHIFRLTDQSVLPNRRAAIVATSAVLIGVGTRAQESDICPKPLVGGGELNNTPYRFAFKSWTWHAEGGHVFCNCIRNGPNGIRTYLEWEGTSLASFVDPDRAIYSYQSYQTDEHMAKRNFIYYGSGLSQVEAKTLIPKTGMRVPDVRPPGMASSAPISTAANASSEAFGEATQTGGRVLIPVHALPASIHDKRGMIEFLQGRGNLSELVPFEMTFGSRIIRGEHGRVGKVSYKCTYRLTPPSGMPPSRRPVYGMRISDPDVHQALFDRIEAGAIGGWPSSESRTSFEGTLSPTSADAVVSVTAGTMEIVALNSDLVVARLPIQFLRVR